MSRGFVLRNPATCCASVETGSVSTASNTTCPASPASTISSYNRFLAFSMTAPPPEKSISGGYRPAGLRRAPESARLPAGCCLCDRCCPKDGDTKTLSLRGTKKAAYPAAILCERRSEATEGDIGESIPRALGLSGGLGIRRRCPFAGQKKQPIRLLFLCERRDSNPYAQRHQILSLAWLPITTRSQNPSEGL